PLLLKLINKSTTLEDFYRTLDCGSRAGIWNGLNLILDFPHETENDFQMMMAFLRERPALYDSCEVNIFRLIAGTGYHVSPEKHGIRVRAVSDNRRICAFDEIGGRS